jgi:HAD superfamily hydrolase (TIGR01548 family)
MTTTPAPPKATTVLLDMDGILAEVSKSYRNCIVKTCKEYGATSITYDTVAEWKARGGCNNDWVLSRDLIQSDPNGDKNVTLDQVTETFERFYQGHGDTPGACELETLIPSRETLKELRERSEHLAIVTGRPRSDCDKFLEIHNITNLFEVCVCMEDGPPKPDAFPVRRACELMGVEPSGKVLMVGDTPDDVRSALAAGCRAIGVSTPEAAAAAAQNGKEHHENLLSNSLKECGAEVVLEPGFVGLLDYLPEKAS